MENVENTLSIPDSSNAADKYGTISQDILLSMCYGLFDFYLRDKIISQFRKMLIIEQYSNSEVSVLFKEIFIDSVLNYQSEIFKELIRKKYFAEGDPYMMAVHFYSPLFLFLFKYDTESHSSDDIKLLIKKHIAAFAQQYVIGDGTK